MKKVLVILKNTRGLYGTDREWTADVQNRRFQVWSLN